MRWQEAKEDGAAAKGGDLMGRPGVRAEAECRAGTAVSAGVAGSTQPAAGAVTISRVAGLAGVLPSRMARGNTVTTPTVQSPSWALRKQARRPLP